MSVIQTTTTTTYEAVQASVTLSAEHLDKADAIIGRAFPKLAEHYAKAGSPIVSADVSPETWARWASGFTTDDLWSAHVADVRESKGDEKARVVAPRRQNFVRARDIAQSLADRFGDDLADMVSTYVASLQDGIDPSIDGFARWAVGGVAAPTAPKTLAERAAALGRAIAKAGESVEDLISVLRAAHDEAIVAMNAE